MLKILKRKVPDFKLILLGHTDSGKSTLGGHLLEASGSINEKRLEALEKEFKEEGRTIEKYSWLFEKAKSDKERKMPVDTSLFCFKTKRASFHFTDFFGNDRFLSNLIIGSSHSCAVFMISAVIGEF